MNLVSGGKNDLPAAGFAMGDVVLTELLKDRKLLPEFNQFIDAYVLIEDEALRNDSLRLVQQIRDLGLNAEYSMAAQKSDKQFKKAMELGALFTVRLVASDQAVVKNLKSREETSMPLEQVAEHLV